MKKIYKLGVICSITLLLYWTMQYSYVEWSKVKLLAGLKQTKSTGSEEPMHRNIHPDPCLIMAAKNSKTKVKLIRKVPNQCHVYISTIILVHSLNTMKQKECFIGISAVIVLHRMARSALTVPVIVKNL